MSVYVYMCVCMWGAALIERQQDVMKLQDGMMVDIERGVDRLYGQVCTHRPTHTDVHTQTYTYKHTVIHTHMIPTNALFVSSVGRSHF